MKKSESIKELAPALIEAQKNITYSERDGKNPHFRSEYSTLASVYEACKSALNAQGFSIVQTPQYCETGVHIETILLHKSGEWISGELYLPVNGNVQQFGSALTYARRYSLASIAGVAPSDDDGNEATTAQPPRPKVLTKDQMSAAMVAMPEDVKSYLQANPDQFKNFNDAAKFYASLDWDVDKIRKVIGASI